MITELRRILTEMQGEAVFFVADGALKEKLIARYMDQADAHAEILDFEFVASYRIGRIAESPPLFDCRLERDDFRFQTFFAPEDFAAHDAEMIELLDLLRPYSLSPRKKEARPARNIIRKKKAAGYLGIAEAARILGLSPRGLKRLIPCSELRVVEDGVARGIEEFFWEEGLIRRFESLVAKQQERRGYNSADLTFIAERCCEGDRRWARDCIVEFLRQRRVVEDSGAV